MVEILVPDGDDTENGNSQKRLFQEPPRSFFASVASAESKIKFSDSSKSSKEKSAFQAILKTLK